MNKIYSLFWKKTLNLFFVNKKEQLIVVETEKDDLGDCSFRNNPSFLKIVST